MYVELGRDILNRAFYATMPEVARQMQRPDLDTLEAQDDIMDFAVRIIKESRERDRAERLARRGG